MEIIRTVAEMRAWRKQAGKLAFVPTMGNLHEGHLKLVAAARERAEKVVVSIFVNRLQFGQGEDFDAYPRTFDADCAKLAAAGVDALFFPSERELYPRVRQDFNVEPPHIQNELCGAFRPGHFRGVATVVTKLFNIVQPDLACFGKKDYQQLHVIQAMIADLNSPIEIVPVDTGRAGDGLALSSRNGYLSAEERAEAPRLYRNLSMIRDGLMAGSQDYAALEQAARDDLAAAGWTVDYVEVRQADTLEIAHAGEKRLVVLAAARLGKTRLIDNIEVFR
ncbi:pantoate--beta-alanine ligase [Chromobacterium violaceum]|uniref:Pantothenate synthetase n=2 Tax=Chromobacterium violaceum TaxID=536 RepID=PANC_CHRVO|nr:pantoate--beta-alanine ligase [Chromobacterium violaceum]Q7NXJ0.1 RecName: Full=Pantothenate synthetase; Short=PS; AltName: Full=Pantoate--beta-alanine ligase; AltName: Full=Pantoate-activating enzyme [Chromobacterium violaceum ATCC 12472]AAQ59312.1 pantoate--beta-alanine ligase [Chromobacterium violaceum ATCC 12472]ATP28271.1 pantoate--beta-alanine ligase [Chromobacterium violaceum]ATP32179.1 pantoate--beta-alanine ligase [Chromobacterium violaceum]KJH68693.1 pantothenate synthetase [Chrom